MTTLTDKVRATSKYDRVGREVLLRADIVDGKVVVTLDVARAASNGTTVHASVIFGREALVSLRDILPQFCSSVDDIVARQNTLIGVMKGEQTNES